ncbi:MAG: S-layer homology domain-containing protein [Candidatus Limnocylindria bacterium]
MWHLEGRARLSRRAWWRILLILAIGLGVATGPAAVLASHLFNDVPTTHQFHGDIGRFYAARITGGCGGGQFCPDAAVSRGQMAAFLNRGLPRVGQGQTGPTTLPEDAWLDLASVTITAGNVTGGTAFVKLDAMTIGRISSTTGCPCEAAFQVLWENTGGQSYATYVTLSEIPSGSAVGHDAASITYAFTVPTGVPQTFVLQGQETGGGGSVHGYGVVNALYVPFSEDGDASLNLPDD